MREIKTQSLPELAQGIAREHSFACEAARSAARGYPFDHFAVVEYIATLKPEPELAIFQAETIADSVQDTPLSRSVWTTVLRIFKGNGYQRRHAGNAVDRYLQDMAKIAAGKKDCPNQVLLQPKTQADRRAYESTLARSIGRDYGDD